jgi:hypothetical protein
MRAEAAAKQAIGQPQASQEERVAIGVTTRSMAAKMRIEAVNAAEAARIHLSHPRSAVAEMATTRSMTRMEAARFPLPLAFVVSHWTRGAGSGRLSSF